MTALTNKGDHDVHMSQEEGEEKKYFTEQLAQAACISAVSSKFEENTASEEERIGNEDAVVSG